MGLYERIEIKSIKEFNGLLNSGEVVDRIHAFKSEIILDLFVKPCIYFLTDNMVEGSTQSSVVYVGKTDNLAKRITEHYFEKREKYKKQFNGFCILTCTKKMQNYLESFYINRYSPKYNIRGIGKQKRLLMAKQLGVTEGYIIQAYGK